MEIPPYWKEFLELLNSEQTEYLIVGGHAVAFHGYPRFTQDFDVLVATNRENAERVLRAFAKFGFSLSRTEGELLLKPEKTFVIGVKPNRIDVLTKISGVDFAEAWEGRIPGDFDGVPVYFIGRQALLKNKASTGRLKDAADVEELTLLEKKVPKKQEP